MAKYKVLKACCDSKDNLKLKKIGDTIERSPDEAKKLIDAGWIEAIKAPKKSKK